METPAKSPQAVVDMLNAAWAADERAVHALFATTVRCNQALADHPTIEVAAPGATPGGPYFAGMIGVLNGVLRTLGYTEVAASWDDGRVTGFCDYQQRLSEQETKAEPTQLV